MKNKFLLVALTCACFPLFGEMYMEKATVSFYGDDFHGKKTSSGEIFNMNDLTCANKTLPFDTLLKVTNLANGNSAEVRVNDRGPFVADRELDLSKAAAEKLGMIRSGTAQVKIEIIKRGPDSDLSRITAEKAMKIVAQKSGGKTASAAGNTPAAGNGAGSGTGAGSGSGTGAATVTASESITAKKTYPAGTLWDLQLGAFSTRENANVLAQKLLAAGFEDVVFQKTSTVYRVVLRKVPGEKVEGTRKRLLKEGFPEPLVKERKLS